MYQCITTKDVFLSYKAYPLNRYLTHDSIVSSGHPKTHLGFMIKGKGYFHLQNGEILTLLPGNLIFIPSWYPYNSHWEGEPYIELLVINFETSVFDPFEYQCQILNVPGIETMYKRLFSTENSSLTNAVLIFELISLIKDRLKKNIADYEASIKPAKEYIENHITQNFTVIQLAKMCHMSESYFYLKFKESMGYSPMDYKNLLRSRKAVSYLVSGNKTLEEICEKLNFSSCSHLRSCLKKFTGKTPSEIKKQDQLL